MLPTISCDLETLSVMPVVWRKVPFVRRRFPSTRTDNALLAYWWARASAGVGNDMWGYRRNPMRRFVDQFCPTSASFDRDGKVVNCEALLVN
jgi:hypothetical protein